MANRDGSSLEMFSGESMMTPLPNPSNTSSIPAAPSSLRPLTIKMLLDSFYEDTERFPLIIDGMPVSMIDLIGVVKNKHLSMNHCTFDLYDGTGSVNVLIWFDCHQDSRDAWSCKLEYSISITMDCTYEIDGVYVRVVGRATSLERFFQINTYMVRTVKNFNDITHHFLYRIKAHIDISKRTSLKEELAAATSASTVMPTSHVTPSQIPDQCSLEEMIFSSLRDPAYRDLEHGVSLKLLRSAVGASQDDIMNCITKQLDIGEIYTIVDERHFKASQL